MKKLLFAFLGILVLLVGAVLIGPGLIDWRPRLAAAVQNATGRTMRIDGDLQIALLPKLRVMAKGVHLANAPGAATPEMFSVDSFALEAELWPLLGKRVVIDSLVIEHPVANLEIAKDGQPNWVFAAESKPAPSGGSSLAAVQVHALKLNQGQVSYRDAASGQTIEAKNVTLVAAMVAPESPATLEGVMTLNDEPVAVDLTIDNPSKLARSEQAKVNLALSTKYAAAKFDGAAQQQPVPGLNGVFDLNIPSVGKLAAWLHQPLDKAQPDPGPLTIHAAFASAGAKSTLTEATIAGTGLNAKASGSIDASGDIVKINAVLESGMLDIDRYLPPQAHAATVRAGVKAPTGSAQPPRDFFALFSDKPFALDALRKIDADFKVSIAGIKAMGYEIGRLAFTGAAKKGVVAADLGTLALYGGNIAGDVMLDGAHDTVDLATSLKIDHVGLDKLARPARAGAAPFTGKVSAALDLKAQGKSPRALAQDMRGHLAMDLGDMALRDAPALSQVKLDLDLPGADKAPNAKAHVVYNGEPVDATASLAPLAKMIAGERFAAKLALDSRLATARYDGAVQQQPVPGLDGAIDADIPSVGKLAAWLGRPLANQPDPGPLKLHAVLTSDGTKLALKDAAITGKAINATARATIDRGPSPATFDAAIDVQQADLNAYLPPSAAGKSAGQQPPASSGWSTKPFDLSPLGAANGKVAITLAAVRYRDLTIANGALRLSLAGRVLKLTAEKLAIAQGTIDSAATIDGSGGSAALDYRVALAGVQARPLLKAFAGSDRLGGTIEFEATGAARGRSQMELVSALDGNGHFRVTNGAIYGINLAQSLRKVGTLGIGGAQTAETDFADLSGSFTIKSGVIDNRDMKMLAPLVRLSGSGTAPMPPQTIDYGVEAKLVASLEGQGGHDALAGVPIAIRITGPWSNPSYQVDWASVFRNMDPEQLKNLPSDLAKAAKGFGVNVPIPAVPGAGVSLPSDIMKQIGRVPPEASPTPQPAPGDTKQQQLPFGLPGLFGR